MEPELVFYNFKMVIKESKLSKKEKNFFEGELQSLRWAAAKLEHINLRRELTKLYNRLISLDPTLPYTIGIGR